jgi:putative aldouronate transport system substrate-binding protein
MSKVSRTLCLLLGVILSTSLLGCSTKKTDTMETPATATDIKHSEELVLPISKDGITLKYWTGLHRETSKIVTDLSEHEVVKEIEKRTGIDLQFLHPPVGQAQEQLNLMVASGDLPDIIKNNFSFYKGGPEAAMKDGILINMNDLINKYAPNFKKIINSDPKLAKAVKSDNGTIIYFGAIIVPPEMRGLPFMGPAIRKDWLDELNLQVPETIDEWYTVLKAFKEKKNIPTPLAIDGKGGLDGLVYTFSGAYGVPTSGFYQENGNVKFGPIENGYKEFLTTLNKWYKEGLIDKDFATHTYNDNTKQAAVTGKTGAWVFHSVHFKLFYELENNKNPKYQIVPTPLPSVKKGEQPELRDAIGYHEYNSAFVTSKCKNPIEAVKLLDYLYSEEGHNLVTWGTTEGKSYTTVAGKKQFTDLIMKNPDGLTYEHALRKYTLPDMADSWDWTMQEAQYSLPEQKDAWKIWGKAGISRVLPSEMTFTEEESTKIASIQTDIDTYVKEMAIKYIMGLEPLSNFDSYVKQVKSMRIDEIINVNQNSLNRYNKR